MSIPREQELLDAAKRAFDNAYAPYSNFQVGAALLGESGAIYWGCNVENATYGGTVCAERNAIADAARNGERKVVACLVITDHHRATPPCGICRQVLREFARDLPIVSHTVGGLRDEWTLEALLPVSFGPEDLLGE